MTENADIRVIVAGRTDTGRARAHNEDNLLLAPHLGLFLVADGMGGHASGKVASAAITASMRNFFEATAGEPFAASAPEDEGLSQSARRLVGAIRKANRDVHEISQQNREHRGMGSTVVAVHLEGLAVTLAHVGDSRCYRVREGTITQLTEDHSLLAEARRAKPDLTEAEAAFLPKNLITRALGMRADVKVDMQQQQLEAGDVLVLCSDGLHGMIENDAIVAAIGLQEDLAQACDLLVELANDAGGNDNISVVLIGAYARKADETVSVEAREEIVEDVAQFEGVLPESDLERLRKGEVVDVSAPRCPACGTLIHEGTRFCVECGGTLV